MDFIITKNPSFFKKIGNYNFCNLEDMILPDKIAFDTETTGLFFLHDDVFCCQIGTGTNNYLIHMYDGNYEFSDVVPYIKNKILVGHNILFDLTFCYKYGFIPYKVFDTMLATKILYNGQLEKSVKENGEEVFSYYNADFGSVMARELGLYYDKTEQKNINVVKLSRQTTIDYSFKDVDKLLELEEALRKKIDKYGFTETYLLHCEYIKALAYIQFCGFQISPKAWLEKMKEDELNVLKYKKQIEEYIFDNIPKFRDLQIDMFSEEKKVHVNLSSPLQMINVFKSLNINILDRDGKESINESVLSKTKHEFIDLWLNFQEANHRVTTFGKNIYDRIYDDRIYTNFNPMVDTARLSTRKGEINFLNFPADSSTRNCFKSKKGWTTIVCDYSGQETVVAADLSQDEAMVDSVINGSCLHCAFARVLFPELKDLSDEDIIQNHKKKRQAAKSPRFAFQYGGSAYTIHINEGIPLDECYVIENSFKELHKGLYVWGEKVFNESVQKGFIESADGWKLYLPDFDRFKELKSKYESYTKEQWNAYSEGKKEFLKKKEAKEKDEVYTIINKECYKVYRDMKPTVSAFSKLKSQYMRLCLNNPVQARSAHQLKRSTVLLFNWIIENNLFNIVKIVNSVHDEIVLECPDELAEKTSKVLSECMMEGGNYYLSNLKIKADANYGESWGEAKS